MIFPKERRLIFRVIEVIFFTILLILGIVVYYIFHSPTTVNINEFQKEGNYSKETLLLFSELAFPYDRVRKWDENIKVEIVNLDKLDNFSINEIDSIIRILSPLIYPIKIYKVSENGNLKVYRKIDEIVVHGDTIKNTQGFCYIPPLFKRLSWNIRYAEVYDIWYNDCIFHEILHAIGLQHTAKQYPFHLNMSDYHIYYSLEDEEKYNTPLYICEEEKLIIKMLYSPYIKSGLTKEEFLKKMKLTDNDK